MSDAERRAAEHLTAAFADEDEVVEVVASHYVAAYETAPAADGSVEVEVHCRARTEARTGVEMEALTGASVAALTLYDMGKAVTHGIVIREIRLLEKTGGRSDYRAP